MKAISHILLFILILLPQYILGQEMYVHSFSHVPSDLSAKVTPKNDTNGELCALVKVAFVEKDADFFGSVLKPVKRISGIYWVYMPKGAYRLRVLHDSFLPLDIDFLSYPGVGKLESGETYELVIKTKGGDNPNNFVKSNFLILNVTPRNASVKVDGKMITVNDKGEAKAFLNNGTHTYSIEANGYLPVNEEVVISGERVIRNISLQSDRPTLTILATTAGTEIYVNEERKGVDSWLGNIDEGTCLIEGRKNGYKTHKMTAEISGKNNNVTIPALIKSVGSLIVNYEPTDAAIYLDNKYIGKTPNVINDIQTGQHELKISKTGYETLTQSLVVKEGQTEISGALKSSIDKFASLSDSKLVRMGVEANKKGNYSEEYQCYLKALEINENNKYAQFNIGLCYEHGRGVTKDYYEAVKWYRKAAEQGHATAQNNIGLCYEHGRGVTQDYYEAVKWYRKAAEQGDADAQYNIGLCYEHGRGVTKDYYEAVKWYRKAAEQGDAYAQTSLGNRYFYGQGVTQDYYEAVKWYRKAAEQGHATAQYNIGLCYEHGRGVTKDYYEAVKWYRKAAEQGDADAQNNLGNRYFYGQGVTQDYYEAVKWYRKAAEQGNAYAMSWMGYFFENGQGVTKDLQEAIRWYKLGAEKGDDFSVKALNRLGVGQ